MQRPIPLPRSLIGPFFLLFTAATMIWWTWGYHTEPMVDFGREIYVPWRLSCGEVLYRDIDYFNGPVSPYFNALIFRIFGATLLTLQVANLIQWAAICTMTYILYVSLSNRLAAFVATMCFILLFSFIQLNPAPIFNYVCPYAHEITQSMLASLGIFLLLRRQLRRPSDSVLAGIGALFGLVCMMKIEVAAAIGAAIGVTLTMDGCRRGTARPIRMGGAFVIGMIAIIASAWAWLWLKMPAGQALDGVMGSWKYLANRKVTRNAFYVGLSGMNHPWLNTRIMLSILAAYAVVLLPPLGLSIWMRKQNTTAEARAVAAAAGALYAAAWLWQWWDNPLWKAAALPLNVMTAAAVLAFATIAISRWRRRAVEWTPRLILQLSFSLFSLLLLWKLILAVSVSHYGFVLTVPAMATFVMFVLCWLPQPLRRRGHSSWIFQTATLTLLGLICFHFLQQYDGQLRSTLSESMGSGANEFKVNFRATALNDLIAMLDRNGSPTDTLAMVPQGAMINFLTHRRNPTGEPVLLPGEIDFFGEASIVARFAARPPDWITVYSADVREFGYKGFGLDYGMSVAAYIKQHYRDVTPADWAGKYPFKMLRRESSRRSTGLDGS